MVAKSLRRALTALAFVPMLGARATAPRGVRRVDA